MLQVRKISIGTNGNRGVHTEKQKRNYGNHRKSRKEALPLEQFQQAGSVRKARSHVEEYIDYDEVKEKQEQCMMRCEALENGKLDLLNNVNKIQETIKNKELQIENITKEQQKIREFIRNLEERIDSLDNHKKMYQEKVTKWKDRELQEWEKIKLIETTISDLRNN